MVGNSDPRVRERIVPDLHLCKRIPKDAFSDSIFVWIDQPKWYREPSVVLRDYSWAATSPTGVYSAPTLEEILAKLCTQEDKKDWLVIAVKDIEESTKTESNLATLYLKEWFQVQKGKENKDE